MQIADQQDNKRIRKRGAAFASRLAPTADAFQCGSEPAREEAGKANKSACLNPAAIAWCVKM
jgi:hypothetical protein